MLGAIKIMVWSFSISVTSTVDIELDAMLRVTLYLSYLMLPLVTLSFTQTVVGRKLTHTESSFHFLKCEFYNTTSLINSIGYDTGSTSFSLVFQSCPPYWHFSLYFPQSLNSSCIKNLFGLHFIVMKVTKEPKKPNKLWHLSLFYL